MIQLSNSEDIKRYRASKRAQIVDSFKKIDDDPKAAKLITKAELAEQFPKSLYELYSVVSLTKFRQEICKAEGVENPDEVFKQATKDLKAFVVLDGKERKPVFIRKKEIGE